MSAFTDWLFGIEQAAVTAVKAEVTTVEAKAVAVVEATFDELVSAVQAKITEFEAFAQKRIALAESSAVQALHFNDIAKLARDEAQKAATVASSLKALFSVSTTTVADVTTPATPAITTATPLQAGQRLA